MDHPDANKDPWSESTVGRDMSKAGYGSSGLDFEMRWDTARKELVPLSKAAGRHSATGETNLYHIASGDAEPGVEGRKQNEEHVATVAYDIAAPPPCCARHLRVDQKAFHIPATLHLKLRDCPINVLIDTGCQQTNIVSTRIAALLRQDGGMMKAASVSLTSGVGGRSYGVQGIMTVKITLMSHELKKPKRMRLRVLVCDDVKIDIIIGLPSIKAFDLLPVLTQHISGLPCCEICGDEEADKTVELGDGVSMTYGHDGHKNIETARATSEERRIHAELNKNGGHEKRGLC